MPALTRRALPGALILLSLAAPATSAAAPVSVNLRVEGATQTIFEGPVITDVHQVTTPADGTARTCDGSSVGSPSAPTAIGALDDASRSAGFAWDAAWDTGFNDYYPFLRIGPDTIDSNSHYLAFFLNWAFAQTGGCGQHVKQGDDVVFAYEDFDASPLLRLSGPGTATTGQSISVKVAAVDPVDGISSVPAGGRDRRRSHHRRRRHRHAQLRPARHLPPQGRSCRRDQVQHGRALRRSARRAPVQLG